MEPQDAEIIEAEIVEEDYLPDVPKDAPAHDPHWLEIIEDEWYEVWRDEEWAQHIRAGLHVPALRRLFTYKSRWHDVNEQLHDAEALVPGSNDNIVANPLYAELRKLEETILRMEKEFGMTLRSASLINLNLGQGELNWAETREKKKAEAIAEQRKQAIAKRKK